MDQIQLDLLRQIADLDGIPTGGAFNIRANGVGAARSSSKNITITPKEGQPGIDIHIASGTKGESMHIPVVISEAGIKEFVYNDFFIGTDCEVEIIAGCGIHSCGNEDSQHDGIHSFFIGENSNITYVEKHYGDGEGASRRIMNPTTVVNLGKNARMEMETTQIAGVDDTDRKTSCVLAEGASLVVREKIMTTGKQRAETYFNADLNGAGSSCNIVSRSVAKDESFQNFVSRLNGNAACTGHTECDAIIMDSASVTASPQLTANNVDASLIHEAAIGKIAGEQLIKLMTLGLSEQEAEEQIVNGFLK